MKNSTNKPAKKAPSKPRDFNSSVNEEIKGKFVAREVYTCFSYEMDTILKVSSRVNLAQDEYLPSYEDIENFYEYKCPECGEQVPEEEDENGSYKCSSCEWETTDIGEVEQEPQEIFEWWIVSEFLYDKLKAKGHPVLEWGNNYYWGRCTTGQAIKLDGAISDICSDMEILDGQKYSWAEVKK